MFKNLSGLSGRSCRYIAQTVRHFLKYCCNSLLIQVCIAFLWTVQSYYTSGIRAIDVMLQYSQDPRTRQTGASGWKWSTSQDYALRQQSDRSLGSKKPRDNGKSDCRETVWKKEDREILSNCSSFCMKR